MNFATTKGEKISILALHYTGFFPSWHEKSNLKKKSEEILSIIAVSIKKNYAKPSSNWQRMVLVRNFQLRKQFFFLEIHVHTSIVCVRGFFKITQVLLRTG